MKPVDLKKGFRNAVGASVDSKIRVTTTFSAALLAYVLLSLAAFPVYSSQLLSADILYLDNAIVALTENSYAASPVSLALNFFYSMLIGVAATNLYVGVKANGLKSFLGMGGAAPGFLAAGCAGCGAGLLSLLGLTGVLALLPFAGKGVTFLGALMIAGSIAYIGDPETCRSTGS